MALNATTLMLVALGSGLGGVLRLALSFWLFDKYAKAFPLPLGIFVVNVLGCFTLGVCAAYLKDKPELSSLYVFLTIGVLGGFTTFSTFSWEVVQLFVQKDIIKACLYATLSTVVGVLACYLGTLAINQP